MLHTDSQATGPGFIPPALLDRARSLAKEHANLTAQTSKGFNAKIAKRVGELQATATALREWEQARSTLDELNTLLSDPTTEPELRDLAAEDIATTATQLESLSKALATSLTPKHPF